MNTKPLLRRLTLSVVLFAGLTAQGMAHCDTMEGPVVKAAKQAINTNDVRYALVWVKPADEAEIRKAFAKTMSVRAGGEAARDLADRYFFETLVRIHRAGEGAPYTGLKEADVKPEPGIAAAEEALRKGSAAELTDHLTAALCEHLNGAYNRVQDTRNYQPGDVEAGRRNVEAYVHFIHYVESLHTSIAPAGATHGAAVEHHDH